MKKLFIVIIILAMIFIGMVVYKNVTNDNNNISIEEINKIEEYISKIYMWKEVTGEALPEFENINNANELWLWEVIKKDLEETGLTYDQIISKKEEIFGKSLKIDFPVEGNGIFSYDESEKKYIPSQTNLDAKEDAFLLNSIEKNNDEYKVEIVEYVLDFSVADEVYEQETEEENELEYEVLIENLNEEVIEKVKNTDSKTYITEIVKNNIDKFNKKDLTIKRNEDNNLEILSVKSK